MFSDRKYFVVVIFPLWHRETTTSRKLYFAPINECVPHNRWLCGWHYCIEYWGFLCVCMFVCYCFDVDLIEYVLNTKFIAIICFGENEKN